MANDSGSSVVQFTDHFANPLYLAPGDSLSTSITSIKLSNDNYHTWSRAITVALSIKNKLQFINGTSSIPDSSDATYAAWNRCNFAVLSWILNSVSDDIAQSLISYDNAASAWNDLKQRFSQCDAIRVADLQSRISSCDQGGLVYGLLRGLYSEFLVRGLVREPQMRNKLGGGDVLVGDLMDDNFMRQAMAGIEIVIYITMEYEENLLSLLEVIQRMESAKLK